MKSHCPSRSRNSPTASRHFRTRLRVTSKQRPYPTRVSGSSAGGVWRCPDLVTLAISANILLVSCQRAIGGKMPLVKSIFQVHHLSKTWGLGSTGITPCYSLLPPWSPLNTLVPKQRAAWLDAAAQVYAQRVGISLSSGGSGSSAGGSSPEELCHEQRRIPQVRVQCWRVWVWTRCRSSPPPPPMWNILLRYLVALLCLIWTLKYIIFTKSLIPESHLVS